MVLSLFILGMNWLIKRDVDPIVNDRISIQTKILNDYFADNDFLRQQKIFSTLFDQSANDVSPQGEDAGPRLNLVLHWIPEISSYNHRAIVPADIQDFILRLGRNWTLHTSPFKVYFDRRRVELKLFSELSKYSYWNVEKNSPIANFIKGNVHVATDSLPCIDSLDLIALAKLRLIQAVFTKDYLPALRDVRKLAELLLTTENYRLELTALAILEAEHSAYVLYTTQNWLSPQSWTPIDSNSTRRANRAIKATKELLRFWTPIPILKQVYLGPHNAIGFCAGITDSLSRELSLRKTMTGSLPFERDYGKSYEILDQIWGRAKLNCHLAYLTAAQATGAFEEVKLPGGPLAYIPYSNKLFGLSQSVHIFEGFKDYVEASPHATN